MYWENKGYATNIPLYFSAVTVGLLKTDNAKLFKSVCVRRAVWMMGWQWHLAAQSLQLLLGTGVVTLSGLFNGGQQQLGITEQGMFAFQIPPQPLLHVKVSVAHLRPERERDLYITLKHKQKAFTLTSRERDGYFWITEVTFTP